MTFQQERAHIALSGALEPMEQSQDGQPCHDAPRRSPRQETPAFFCWQLDDPYQVHGDGGLERRNGRLPRFALDGAVEIRAHRMPPLAASVGVTLQGGHIGSSGRRAAPRTCQASILALPAARATPVLDFPEARASDGGTSCVPA